MRFIDRDEVARRLTYEIAIPLVREAMIAFSTGITRQHLRSILPLANGHLFGIMPGALAADGPFGAKLLTVFPDNPARGLQSHGGVIVLFEPDAGEAVCCVHAGEVTAIRTAAASAVATEALARPDARRLALLGYGEQAATHARAMTKIRDIESITVWGRSPERAAAFARTMHAEIAIPVNVAASAAAAVAEADIVCTLTSAQDPILARTAVQPGTHLNVVGSSHAGPSEIDNELVAASRFFADSREGVLVQGGEFLRAQQAGLVTASHIVGEIGDVLARRVEGRRSPDEITIYKSLGHIVQDLACAWWLYSQPEADH